MKLEVKDMTCWQCASAINKALKHIDKQAKVDIDVATRMVRIDSTCSVNDFLSAIQEAGYTPVVSA
jgi:copper chaperone